MPGAGERRARRGGHGGGAPQLGMAGHVGRVLGVAAAAQVHPLVLGDPEGIGLVARWPARARRPCRRP